MNRKTWLMIIELSISIFQTMSLLAYYRDEFLNFRSVTLLKTRIATISLVTSNFNESHLVKITASGVSFMISIMF